MTKKALHLFFLTFVVSFLIGCSDNNKKIIGTWERTVTENDGGKYLETYTFYDDKYDNRVEYSYVPEDYSHIGYKANGRWDLDLVGNLELYLDPGSAKAIYNFYPDEWQKAQINMYIAGIKINLSQQLKEMEEASIGLEFADDVMILETLTEKGRFHRANFMLDSQNDNMEDTDYEEDGYAIDDGPQDIPVEYETNPFNINLVGEIGNYPVEMILEFKNIENYDLGEVEGKYRYTKTGSGAYIKVIGVKKADHLNLTEYNEAGNPTGEFNGELTIYGNLASFTYSGTFTTKQDKSFPFTLRSE